MNRIRKLEETSEQNIEEIKSLTISGASIRTDLDKLTSSFVQLKSDFGVFRIDTNGKIIGNKEELQDQIYSTDRYVGEI